MPTKVLQKNSTFGKKYFKNLVRSLRGSKWTSICIICMYSPQIPKSKGHQVPGRMAALSRGSGWGREKHRCWRSVRLMATGRAGCRMPSSPLSLQNAPSGAAREVLASIACTPHSVLTAVADWGSDSGFAPLPTPMQFPYLSPAPEHHLQFLSKHS